MSLPYSFRRSSKRIDNKNERLPNMFNTVLSFCRLFRKIVPSLLVSIVAIAAHVSDLFCSDEFYSSRAQIARNKLNIFIWDRESDNRRICA